MILCRRGHVFWLRTLEKQKQTFSKVTKSLSDLFHLVKKREKRVMLLKDSYVLNICSFSTEIIMFTDINVVFSIHRLCVGDLPNYLT